MPLSCLMVKMKEKFKNLPLRNGVGIVVLNKKNKVFFKNLFDECSILMQTILRLPQPVIAEVCGIAAAAGCQLVASCDLAVAS